jgi:uncharacterized membrane protein YqjE
MEKVPSAPAGLLSSFRTLGDGLLASVQDRLELFSVEMEEEKLRFIQTMFWISGVLCAGVLAVLFASLTLVYFCWEHARLTVLGGLAVFYATLFLGVVITFRRFLARQPRPFAATRAELGEDRSCIRSQN